MTAVDLPKSEGRHPCMKCGACCAYYRVSFETTEVAPEGLCVPVDLAIRVDDAMSVMSGTDRVEGTRCKALTGEVGKNGTCSIYENRPSPCRLFQASYEFGIKQPRCDEARAVHGLPPLTIRDYDAYRNSF